MDTFSEGFPSLNCFLYKYVRHKIQKPNIEEEIFFRGSAHGLCVDFINALVLIKVHIIEFHNVIFADTLPFYRQIKQIKTSVQSGSAVP